MGAKASSLVCVSESVPLWTSHVVLAVSPGFAMHTPYTVLEVTAKKLTRRWRHRIIGLFGNRHFLARQ
jgi:hypothetical protein